MRLQLNHRVIAVAALLVALAQAASLDDETVRERSHRQEGRHLRRSFSSADGRQHHRGRRRAETIDNVVHQTEPKFDEVSEALSDICTNPVANFDARDALADLKASRRKFGDLQDYDMRIQRACFCVEECRYPFSVIVRGGIIVNVTNDETKLELNRNSCSLPTIAGIFQQIETACTQPYANLSVVYDGDMGYPANTWFDENECIIDEEVRYAVTDLVDMTPQDDKGKEGDAPSHKGKPDDKPSKPGNPSRRV